jgi:protein gp37
MAGNTEIAWCDSTFNPWEGCQKVGPGCDNCYAEARNARFGGGTAPNWGRGAPRRRTSAANWRKPVQWNNEPFYECRACGWRGGLKEATVESMGCMDVVTCPHNCDGVLRLARRRVFCASLADVFDNQVPTEWRMDLFKLIADTSNLDWLLLTKRIGNVMPMCSGDSLMLDMISERVWLGATVVNQEEADRDIPKLLATPARVRFLSCEPMLGPVDLSPWLSYCERLDKRGIDRRPGGEHVVCDRHCGISWVIVGGESGPGARPFDVSWARSIVAQCRAAGVPVMVKQLGAHVTTNEPGQHWPRATGEHDTGRGNFRKHLIDRKGGDWSEWPEDLRVRQFPEVAP